MGKVQIAEDKYKNKLQFAHLDCASAQNITTATQWDTTSDRHVVITPTSADAYVSVNPFPDTITVTGISSFYNQIYTANAANTQYTGNTESDAYFVKSSTQGWVIKNDGGEEVKTIFTGFGFGDVPKIIKVITVNNGNLKPDAALTYSSAGNVTPDGTGSGNSLGKLVTFGSSYTTIVRAGEYIGASATVNVVSLGEL